MWQSSSVLFSILKTDFFVVEVEMAQMVMVAMMVLMAMMVMMAREIVS